MCRLITRSVLLLLLFSVPSPPAFAGDDHPVEFAEPRPDKALVYFIRTSHMSGAAGTMYLYADQTFLGVMDNGTYGYAHVDPGRRLLWVVWGGRVTREIELVPGETYYLEVWMDIGVVDESRGQELIQKVGRRVTPDEREVRKSAKHIRNRYDRAVENEGLKEKVALAEIAPTPPPENTEGLVKVPAYTPMALELLETVTSEFSPAGAAVHFRVAEDASVDGRVIVGQGTIVEGVVREAEPAGGLGKAGILEIVVPFLVAIDGTRVPLVAQLALAGKGRQDVVAGLLLGILPGLAVRGREAYYLAGEGFRVWTRGDTWVKPGEVIAVEGADFGASPAAIDELEARGPESVRFNPRKGYAPDDLKIVLAASVQPAQAEVRAVGGVALPVPVRAARINQVRNGWECVFDGWSVVRFMRPGDGQSASPIDLVGRLADERPFSARVAVDLLIER